MTNFIRSPLFVAALLATMIGLFIKLGFWQLERADEKTVLAQAGQVFVASETLVGKTLPELWAKTIISGNFIAESPSLLDSQTYKGQQGYQVFSRFALNSGQQLLINRGWIAQQHSKSLTAVTNEPLTLSGIIAPYRRAGMRLGPAVVSAPEFSPVVVNYPTQQEWQRLYQQPLLAVTLWLDADQPFGYLRDWQLQSVPAEKHWGYAFQWFAMAIAVAVISLILLIRLWRQHDKSD